MARLYLSGKMTGEPEYNFPAFAAAACAWRAAGWTVFNPAEQFEGATDRPYREYVVHDIAALRRCDALAVLSGWDAPGARGSVWEAEIARTLLDIPVYDATVVRPPLYNLFR